MMRPTCCSRYSITEVILSEASPTISKSCVAFTTFLAAAAVLVGYPSLYLIQTNAGKVLSVLSGLLPLGYGTLLLVCNLVQVVNREDGSKEVELKKEECETLLDWYGLHSATDTERNGVSSTLKWGGVYPDALNQIPRGLLPVTRGGNKRPCISSTLAQF